MTRSTVERWQTLRRKKVFEGKRFSVDSVDFARPGNEAWRDVSIKVEPDAVAILAITTDHKIIVVKQYRPGPDEILIELPAGDIDHNEAPIFAAKRELLEETGYVGKAFTAGISYRDAYSNGKIYSVVVTDCVFKGIPSGKKRHESLRAVILVSIEEYRDMLTTLMTNSETGLRGMKALGLL